MVHALPDGLHQHGSIAQSVEQGIENPRVGGSNPSRATKFFSGFPMPAPVRFLNRRTGQIEEEQIYGENALRWTYESGLGRVALSLLVKRPVFSRWYGWRMSRPASKSLIAPFLADYGLDPSEFADPVESFASFNEFFFRKLKPDARPICADPDAVVFPADGRHFCLPEIGKESHVFAKGQCFDLPKLLGDAHEAFAGGTLLISRLCPVDYHRFHFPCGGTPGPARLLNGPLFSVSPIALARNLAYLWENKRMVTLVDTPNSGKVAVVEIGATCVGAIHQTYAPDAPVTMGAEKGYFAFGGSCVITVFQKGRVELCPDLLEASANGLESHALMGQKLGTAVAG